MDINTLHKPTINFKAMSWYERFITFCGVGFGSGLSPKAPGTFGSAFALLFVPIWLAIGLSASVMVMIIMSLIGIYICDKTAELMGVHDDGRIVWDEFAGQSITFTRFIFGTNELAMAPHWFCPIPFIRCLETLANPGH